LGSILVRREGNEILSQEDSALVGGQEAAKYTLVWLFEQSDAKILVEPF
jgi:hypothetical protein